ncbi:hydrolase, alpha/beta domain protein [Sphingobacterium spiritivorum ATCC 33300]|uniref:Hydrolase, alpha/beta domain protein n=1 Tax=Sphingobacterium spiritivorum ATCC 33300 TaxID=525372 RepID=C2FV65_SPHSI|nr:alpha/beta hydrolase [Sphingobacterium spiritivorum]EEI93188.1 hydrolase, alpha/beta domain protein [Sphingobacterium spiritivorum ATCC 33300]QQS96099.1 alpha/beta hydrolase [Sphingobacterium spiritivorum]
MMRYGHILIYILLFCGTAQAQNKRPVLDIMLTNYAYPYEVHYLNFQSQGQEIRMAYMDVQPSQSNGKTVMLLHGKNFNGAYWKTTVESLVKEGYRVIVPDQIGFGKSSKPVGYQFTFQQLASNTKLLLEKLKVNQIYLLGHSMGGMLATRFTLMYPDMVGKLILENPIGLEDWKLVAPYTTIDENYQNELKADYETTRNYQSGFYYDNNWKAEYDEWVYLLTGWVKSPDYPIVAMNNAQTSDMIFTQPVVYEFSNIKTPTLLIIGTRDRTAIGKNKVKDSVVREKMGLYQFLGKETQQKIKGSQLVELDNVGHLPHIEVFDQFIKPLKGFLANQTGN